MTVNISQIKEKNERFGFIAGGWVMEDITKGFLKIIPYINDNNLWFMEYIPENEYKLNKRI
jgi:hypothetical protein